MNRITEAGAALLCLSWGFVMINFFPQEIRETASVSAHSHRAAVAVPASAAESAIAMADIAPEKV